MDAASKPKAVRRTMIFLGLGVAAGLFLGLGLLYVVSLFDDRFASLGELSSQIPEVVIGQIPNIRTSRRHPGLELVHTDDERHAFAESFRNMRSWLLFSGDKAKQPRLILVTSAVPIEGKSTVSSNLALTLALSGSRVLLIDADLRRAGLDKIFDVPNDLGFADVLEQRASAKDLIQPTKTPNLWLLPAGSATMNPGELFLAPSCDIFLAKIRSQYNYIIFDSAPVLATDDTANLAPKINAVLFVVRADYTSARNAREALQQLRQRQATILGLVFNRSIATRTGGYYYRYNNYYYYGHNGQKRKRSKQASASRVTVAAAADTDKRA
jgi:capsular exopolysaccharide synthesis family protein